MGKDGEVESMGKGGDKAKKLDTSFKKAIGGSLKLKGVEFKGCVCSPPHDSPRCARPEHSCWAPPPAKTPSVRGSSGEEPCLCGMPNCVLVLVLMLVGAGCGGVTGQEKGHRDQKARRQEQQG